VRLKTEAIVGVWDDVSEGVIKPAPPGSRERSCDAKMYHMKRATLRDLRYKFGTVEHLLEAGEEIEITRRKRVIARLLPPAKASRAERPDFLGRLRQIYGRKRLKISGADLLGTDRARF